MKLKMFEAFLLSFALAGFVSAQGTEEPNDTVSLCSQSHLKQLAHEARTQEQYTAVAGCYDKLQKNYLEKAAEEKQEWERRSQNVTASAAKYPRPVDSARNLYEHYQSKASEAGELSAKYSQLASH